MPDPLARKVDSRRLRRRSSRSLLYANSSEAAASGELLSAIPVAEPTQVSGTGSGVHIPIRPHHAQTRPAREDPQPLKP